MRNTSEEDTVLLRNMCAVSICGDVRHLAAAGATCLLFPVDVAVARQQRSNPLLISSRLSCSLRTAHVGRSFLLSLLSPPHSLSILILSTLIRGQETRGHQQEVM